ncbi:MAG: type II secretion system protein [Campylobacterota bacterium]|nr:type II secretion system protein [Campylobacterota bacterium]
MIDSRYKKAFSLIELLIVVLIIGVVYTLAITNFQKVDNQSIKVNLATLKKYLQTFPSQKNVQFLCLDDCSSCSVLVDGKKDDSLEGVFDNFLDDKIEVYRYEFASGVQEIEHELYFNEENSEESVCFSYKIDKQGIGDQVIIKFREKVYDYTDYSLVAPVYESIDEVIELKESLVQEVMQ